MDLFKQFPGTSLLFEDEYKSLFEAFEQRGVSSVDLVSLSYLELAKATSRSAVITRKFQQRLEQEIADTINITPVSMATLECDVYKKFTTGDESIDQLLHGGIDLGAITEVVGASATGKSHLLLQLAITVQFPRELGGMGFQISDDVISSTQTTQAAQKYQAAKVVYISTESGIETRRLSQICENFHRLMETNGIHEKYWPNTDNVFQITCNDLESQDQVIFYQLPHLLKTQPIKLVIVDSIAHHLRIELNSKDKKANLSYFYKLANFLKKMAIENSLAVVVSNQVSDRPMRQIYGEDAPLVLDYQLGWLSGWDHDTTIERQTYSEGSDHQPSTSLHNNRQIPALGLTWQNKVDNRIVLSKYRKPIWDELLASIREREVEAHRRRMQTEAEIQERQAQQAQREQTVVDEIAQQLYEGQEDEFFDMTKHYELKRTIWFDQRTMDFEIWKGGLRSESRSL